MRGRGLSSVSVVFAASPLKPTAGLRLNPESPRKEILWDLLDPPRARAASAGVRCASLSGGHSRADGCYAGDHEVTRACGHLCPADIATAQKAVRTPGTVPRPGGYNTSARPPRPLFHHPRKTAAGSRVGGTGLVSGGAVARGKAVCSDERGQRSQVQSAVGRWRVGDRVRRSHKCTWPRKCQHLCLGIPLPLLPPSVPFLGRKRQTPECPTTSHPSGQRLSESRNSGVPIVAQRVKDLTSSP